MLFNFLFILFLFFYFFFFNDTATTEIYTLSLHDALPIYRGGLCFQNFGGVGEFLRSFKLSFRVNDFCTAFALGFGLLGDGALHLLGDVDLFHLDFGNLNAPRFGVGVEYDLKLGVDFIALRENFIEFELSDDAANGGLRELRRRVGVVLHLGKGQIGVDYAEVANSVDLHGHIVTRDDVLRRNVKRLDTQIDTVERFNWPENQVYAGGLCYRYQAPEPKDDTAFPFFNDVNRIPEPNEQEAKAQRYCDKGDFHVSS